MEYLLYTGAGATALIAVSTVVRGAYRVWRRVDEFLRGWAGDGQTPSMPERVSALEVKVHSIKEQVTPNGGTTAALGDRVVRIEKHLAECPTCPGPNKGSSS